MQLSLVAIGRARAGPARALFDDYAERIRKAGPGLGIRGFKLLERPESRASTAPERMKSEGKAIIEATTAATTVVLDEGGENITSAEFARWFGQERDCGTADLAFVIGGPDGLSDPVRNNASRAIAFGRATWPHLMARALLAEQIYRALTILGRHPYHRN